MEISNSKEPQGLQIPLSAIAWTSMCLISLWLAWWAYGQPIIRLMANYRIVGYSLMGFQILAPVILVVCAGIFGNSAVREMRRVLAKHKAEREN